MGWRLGLLGSLGLLTGLAGAPAQQSREDGAAPPSAAAVEPVPLPLAPRKRLRALGLELAKTGEAEWVERVADVLARVGEPPEELERFHRNAEKALEGARPERVDRAALAQRVTKEAAALALELEPATESWRALLARAVLALDAEEPSANAVIGRKRDRDGTWLTHEEQAWRLGAGRVADLVNAAGEFPIEVEEGPSPNPALRALAGGGQVARAENVELHGPFPAATLARILRQGLRAAVLSSGLLRDELVPPRLPRPLVLVLVDRRDLFLAAVEEARTSGGLGPEEARQTLELGLGSFPDRRGWTLVQGFGEAELEADLLWRLLRDALPRDTQPCLRVGHVNGLCLRFLGTSMPLLLWSEKPGGDAEEERSRGSRALPPSDPTLWRSARRGLWGSRSWMIEEVRAHRDPPWARTMLDQDGKIADALLLKATLVAELLHVEGRMAELVEVTRGPGDPVPRFEAALGESLTEFEARWRRWLDPPRESGLAQDLRGGSNAADREAGPFAAALLLLNQARADALAGQAPEIPIVRIDPELSRAAELHARYLLRNPDQRTRWPDVHEEYAGAPGFSAEGALAASRSLIALDRAPEAALRSWLGSFYHRLPLLEPGLFGAGFGTAASDGTEVLVLDVGSLVLAPWKDHVSLWPLPDATDVPLRFEPEVPSPVPGADLGALGYPITLQLVFATPRCALEATLELFREGSRKGAPKDAEPEVEPVEAYFLSPSAPLEPRLAPPNAWGLIPKAPLARKTRYRVHARWDDQERTWSFTTGG